MCAARVGVGLVSRTARELSAAGGGGWGPDACGRNRGVGKPGASLTLVALTALAFAPAACGGGDDGGDEVGGTDTAAEDETTGTEDPREALEAEIVAAYEASWTDFIEAGDPPSPEAEDLMEHLSGEALETTRDLLRQYEAEGVILRGAFEVDARVRELADDRGVVEDCGLDQLELVTEASGTVVEGHDDDRDGYLAELALEGSSWKVISLVKDGQVCR
jgi:hypothetical protein